MIHPIVPYCRSNTTLSALNPAHGACIRKEVDDEFDESYRVEEARLGMVRQWDEWQ